MTGGAADIGAGSDPDEDRLEISIGAGDWGDPDALERLTARAVDAAFAVEGLDPARLALSFRFADDAEIQDLNARFRDQAKPTNVLSWPSEARAAPLTAADLPPKNASPLFLGDVALACETVANEAISASKPLEAHVTHLIVHGVLHLLGHDHFNEAEAARMEARETEALARLGVSDPYEDREPD